MTYELQETLDLINKLVDRQPYIKDVYFYLQLSKLAGHVVDECMYKLNEILEEHEYELTED